MLVTDIKLGKKDVSPRVQQVLSEIIEILNEDGYQRKKYAQAPTSASAGVEGEKRIVQTGANFWDYAYASGSWWYSSAYTQVT